MGTSSFIAIKTENRYEGIYCHYNGHVWHNGVILQEHYQDLAKIKRLIELGDLSTLGKEIGQQHEFGTCPENQCIFYGRDRGNKDTKPISRMTFRGLLNYANRSGCEVFYLFQDGCWKYAYRKHFFFRRRGENPFHSLRKLI